MAGLGNNSNSRQAPPERQTNFRRDSYQSKDSSENVQRRQENTHPPLGWFLASVLCTLVTLYLLVAEGFSGHSTFHFAGAVVGMIIGLVLMGLFRQAINQRTSSGTFADWVVSSTKLGTFVSASGWLFGLTNLVIFAIEISR